MAFIETITETDASADVRELYNRGRLRDGSVANSAKAFSHRPAVLRAWRDLNVAIMGTMDRRRYELATLAAARRLRSSYCALAHGALLANGLLEPEAVRDVAVGLRSDALDATEVAIVELADKIVVDAASIQRADIDRLRDLGLSDAEIFDVVAAVAARCFFSKTLDALGIQPDHLYKELEPQLRTALTVGRPIADE
jgi:uncharacterized peroxidase-related enzyme